MKRILVIIMLALVVVGEAALLFNCVSKKKYLQLENNYYTLKKECELVNFQTLTNSETIIKNTDTVIKEVKVIVNQLDTIRIEQATRVQGDEIIKRLERIENKCDKILNDLK